MPSSARAALAASRERCDGFGRPFVPQRPYGGSTPRYAWRRRSGRASLFASGGALFTAEKCRKRAGGCGPRSPVGPRGVHPRKRHRPGRYAPPGCPVPYCPPLPGFARASRIGLPLRLHNASLRPHQLPRNVRYEIAHGSFYARACGGCVRRRPSGSARSAAPRDSQRARRRFSTNLRRALYICPITGYGRGC